MWNSSKVEVNPRRQGKDLHEVQQTKIAAQTLIRQYNSSSLYLFQTIRLAAEKFYTSINSMSRNLRTIFLQQAPKMYKNTILIIKLEL